MATSVVEVANQALDAVGTRSTIASLVENSPEAKAVSRHFANARRAVLRAAHWNFARRQVALSLLLDATQGQTVPQPWVYEYAYPPDCVLARYIMPVFQPSDPGVPGSDPNQPVIPSWLGPPVRFLTAQDSDPNGSPVKVILTNQPSAQLVYTADTPNVSLWDDLFVESLGLYLGVLITPALTGDKAQQKSLFDMARLKVSEATAINGNEGITVQDLQPDWMRVRGYASDWAYPDGGMFINQPQMLTLIG